MGLVASTDRRPVFYFIGDSITEQASDPSKSGFITLLQDHYVRSVDMINRGLSGYTTKWVLQHGMAIFSKELQLQYSASFVTVFLGANDAIVGGPDLVVHVPLEEYRANLQKMLHMIQPLLAPGGKVLLITPPCIIDSERHGDRTNAAAGKYARACVELAAEENVHVLDLHTYFNTTFPDVKERQTYFVDGLHFSAKGHKEVGKLLSVAINGMFDKEELKRFDKWQLPDWHDFIH
ncbi:SGNH hydrolase-type esterase domain [Phytophthora cactorum]|nr:SGNH hydrolase-type esterase domain [Phytophthora cactorum]